MSAVSKEAGGSNQDFDLNIAPIIDCFTVLITYLLVSASFLTLNILDVGVAADGIAAPQTAPTEPPVSFALELSAAKIVMLRITGGARNLDVAIPIQPFSSGDWDVRSVIARISAAMAQYPAVKEISVTADPTVRYKEIIQVIDPLKKVMPKVYLSGK